jgi:hypothetical protein
LLLLNNNSSNNNNNCREAYIKGTKLRLMNEDRAVAFSETTWRENNVFQRTLTLL